MKNNIWHINIHHFNIFSSLSKSWFQNLDMWYYYNLYWQKIKSGWNIIRWNILRRSCIKIWRRKSIIILKHNLYHWYFEEKYSVKSFSLFFTFKKSVSPISPLYCFSQKYFLFLIGDSYVPHFLILLFLFCSTK